MPTVTLTPTNDTFADEGTPDAVRGASATLQLGYISGGRTWAHLQFDLSSIPGGSTITSATLRLAVEAQVAGNAKYDLYALGASWAEGTLTWNNKPATTGSIRASGTISQSAGQFHEVSILSLVQDWYSAALANNGLLMQALITGGVTWLRSKEYSDSSLRPQLVVIYSAPPTAPVVTVPNGGETFDATHNITWTPGSDPDGGPTTVDIELSTNGGTNYSRIVTGTANDGTHSYDFSGVAATSTARIRIRTVKPDGLTSAWDDSNANFTISHNVAPSKPTLQSPPNGSTVDLAAGYNFSALYQDANAGDSLTAFAIRRKVGAGAYEYYNVGTASWQSTLVWNNWTGSTVNPGGSFQYTFGSGKWTNGTTYDWSFNTKDALGTAGTFADDFTVTGGTAPLATVTAPSGTVTDTSTPVVTWTHFDAQGHAQASARVKIFSAAQYGAGGFNPESSTATWDSGVINSTTQRDIQVGTSLTNSTTYRAYAKTTSATSGISSSWAYSEFTLNLTAPSAPSIGLTWEPDDGRVRIDVTGTHSEVTFPETYHWVERSVDAGITWELIIGPVMPTGLLSTSYDYEYPPNKSIRYRAYVTAEV